MKYAVHSIYLHPTNVSNILYISLLKVYKNKEYMCTLQIHVYLTSKGIHHIKHINTQEIYLTSKGTQHVKRPTYIPHFQMYNKRLNKLHP